MAAFLYPVPRRPLLTPSFLHVSGCKTTPSCLTPTQKPLVSLAALATAAALLLQQPYSISHPSSAFAVSGGGKDYASQNWDGSTFHGDYSEKDFSGGLFRGCDFRGAILRSARFFKAELREADLTGADLSFATVEAAILRDAVLRDAVMVGSYVSDSVLDVAAIEGVDFSDALISPASVVSKLCAREDATGVNPTTGVGTRDSLMCPD